LIAALDSIDEMRPTDETPLLSGDAALDAVVATSFGAPKKAK
jgi:hypothetical protein